jgi:uncharacterized protein with ParB-like and HNH nuclease domain
MAEGLAAHEHPLSKIFCSDYQFEIPSYQRPYSWEQEQVGELFDDVLAGMRRAGGREDAEPYFLGSLVLIKAPGSPRAQVVDGQQRLTTLTMLFAALRDMISREDVRASLERLLVEPGDPLRNLVEQPRLTVWDAHREFFAEHVTRPTGLRDLNEQALAGAQQLVQLNSKLLISRLQALPEEDRIELARFLVSCTYLVVVSTPDENSAHRIFAVMNDRGMQLSHTDILKAEILGEITAADRDSYAATWAAAEEAVGRDAFGDLFAHVRMIYAKTKPEKSILEEFRRHVLDTFDRASYRQVISDLIEPYADAQAILLTTGYKAATCADEVNYYLKWLGRLDNSDWQPPALWALVRWRNDPTRLAAFMCDLERLAATMFIRRADVNTRIRRYGEVLRALQADSCLSDPGVLGLTSDEHAETMECLSGPVYETARTRLYVLLRLDEALAGGGASYEHKIITVEHVLPQSPKPDSQWTVDFSPDEQDYWLHRLANLVLLDRRKNSAAANLDFDAKKRRYFATEGQVSPFALTTTVIQQARWTPVVLHQRQEDFLAGLEAVWDL